MNVFPSGGGAYTYVYDSAGIRTSKNVNGESHKYYYSGSTLMTETWSGGKYIEYMYDESGRPQSMYYYNGTTRSKYYFVKNIQGDVVQLRAEDNSLVAEYIYSG